MNVISVFRNPRLVRYFFVALSIVAFELVVFQIIFLLSHNYMLATVMSFALAVVANWILSRLVVFGASHHHPAKEFLLVLLASIVGVGIQLAVIYGSVEVFGLYPLIGKILSICFSFFWNYWFRAKIVYKQKHISVEDVTAA